MNRSRTPSQGGGSQGFEMERKYSVPSNPETRAFSSEDLHAWSIYRQNLNSDFTDSALGSTDKSPLPYGNFQLRDTTVQSIMSHPRYGPKSALGSNMYAYLKFGLPRVFPPNHNESGGNRSRQGTPQHFNRGRRIERRSPRDGSSGYDSSDNETTNHNNEPYKRNRKYRSDPDFRLHSQLSSPITQAVGLNSGECSNLPLAAMSQNDIMPSTRWNRNKSVSEANLLASDYSGRGGPPSNYGRSPVRNPRRSSVADLGHFNRHAMDQSSVRNLKRPLAPNRPESYLSAATSRGPSVIRSEFSPLDEDGGPAFLLPHLQVCNIATLKSTTCISSSHDLIFNDITFETYGGQLLAVMSTSAQEGTAILEAISGRRNVVSGDIILNGQRVRRRDLESRVAYVQDDHLGMCGEMTALQTMNYHGELRRSAYKERRYKLDSSDRINVLIEDLGLEQIRNTPVNSMTLSEKRRLNVACHLLLDTDIVVLDQPTRGMDIFDTFFLIEYLKQWACGGGSGNVGVGRIVILTVQPPTYEIFTMLTRILLISAGRTMFSGKRGDMLPYFASVDYPCPNYKNPSDYYLDLVTLDDLSAEAMLESSQRIEQLAELFRIKQPPLNNPGQPCPLPGATRQSNVFQQGFVLFMKSMIYTQPSTFLTWLSVIILSASLSLIIGFIFWDIPTTDPQLLLNDRFGYHYTVMCITPWPLLLYLTYVEVNNNKKCVERDIKEGLYGRITYIITKTLINIFPSLFVWLIYIVPSYSMCGLYMQSLTNYEGFSNYVGLMLFYFSCLQILILSSIYIIPYTEISSLISITILTSFFLSSGYAIHLNDVSAYTDWLHQISPTSWLLPYYLNRELNPEALQSTSVVTICRNKQIQHHDIILPCPTPNGTKILANYNFAPTQNQVGDTQSLFILLLIFYLIFFVIVCIAFKFRCFKGNKHSRNREIR